MKRLLVIFFLFAFPFSANATFYYCSSSATGGEAGSFVDPFTLQEAADIAASGDFVFILNDGTYSETSTIDFDTNAGASGVDIVFRGVDHVTTSTQEVVTIDGTAITGDTFDLTNAVDFLQFQNIRITNSDAFGVDMNCNNISFRNCQIDNSGSAGVQQQDNFAMVTFINCEINNNGAQGVVGNVTSRGQWKMTRSSIHDNTTAGVEGHLGFSVFEDCLIYDNGSHGIFDRSGGDLTSIHLTIIHCTVFANDGSGVYLDDTDEDSVIIERSIFRNNGAYAIQTDTVSPNQFISIAWNCFSNNTSGDTNLAGGIPDTEGGSHTSTNPGFTSEVDGSEDLTPSDTDLKATIAFPAGATAGEEWMGAVQVPETGGATAAGPLVGPGRIAR